MQEEPKMPAQRCQLASVRSLSGCWPRRSPTGRLPRAMPSHRPGANIVIILADDMAMRTSAARAARTSHPHIGLTARNGVRFTSGYASCPVCSPTRAGLMTGRYQERFGHEFNPGPRSRPGSRWACRSRKSPWLSVSSPPVTARPWSASGTWVGRVLRSAQPWVRVLLWVPRRRTLLHRREGGFRESYLARAGTGRREGVPDRRVLARGGGFHPQRDGRFAAEANPGRSSSTWPTTPCMYPCKPAEVSRPLRDIPDPTRRVYAGMVAPWTTVWARCSRSCARRRSTGDTLIFFLSDNGGPIHSNARTTIPSRKEGRTLGRRHPSAIHCAVAGVLPAGRTDDRLVSSLDILPTALAAAGGNITHADKLDGVNLLPYLTGLDERSPHQALYWRYGPDSAIRKTNWKLLKLENRPAMLFNLGADIGEKYDLAEQEPGWLRN